MKEQVKAVLKSSVVGRCIYPFVQILYRSVAIPVKRHRLQKYGAEMLGKLHKVLNENKIKYYLDFGTLLGVVREGGFIKHDDDIDLTIADVNANAKEILQKLLSHGFRFIHALTVRGRIVEFSVSFNKLSADFFFCLPVDIKGKVGICGVYFDPSAQYESPDQNNYRVWYFPDDVKVKEIQFKGVDVCIPECPEQILEFEYGKGWRSPVKNWSADELRDRYKVMDDYAVRITDINEVIKG